MEEPCAQCLVDKLVATGEPQSISIPYPDKDHMQTWLNISAFPILDEKGEIVRVIVAARDITEIKKMAEEKELLLREVHHRVKNNLNVVISLLRLQLGVFSDENLQTALQNTIDRIRAMALIHQYLYKTESLKKIGFKGFVEEVIEDLNQTYGTGGNLDIVTDIEDTPIHVDAAIPVSPRRLFS